MFTKFLLKSFILFSLACNLLATEKVVRLSNFNPKRANATEAFRKAINTGAPKVVIDNPGFPLQIDTVHLHSNQEVVFEDGVIVEARKNSFKGLGPFLFSGRECKNIVLRGQGKAILRMRKKDYQNKKLYRHSEWRHLFGLKGCENIQIRNLTLESSGGDGIYLGNTNKVPYCKDIILEDLVISEHHRQGISVISAENLTIRRCLIENTSGTNPASGIDFEPNSKPKGQRLINCLVEDCKIIGNAGAGIEFYTVYMENGCPPQSITVRNCLIKDNKRAGILVKTSFHRKGREKTAPPTGYINFKNCQIIDNVGPGIIIKDQLATVKLSFENCYIKVNKSPRSYPIMLVAQTMRGAPIGGVIFKDLTIDKLPEGRAIMPFKSWTNATVDNIKGNILVKNNKQIKQFPLQKHIQEIKSQVNKRNKNKFSPITAYWRRFYCTDINKFSSNTTPSNVKTKNNFDYTLWAEAGKNVKIDIKKIPSIRNKTVKLKLTSAKKEIKQIELKGKQVDSAITFKAPQTGCYLLHGSSGGEKIIINSTEPGGWCQYKKPLTVAGKHNKLFFAVPEKVKNFKLEVAGCLTMPLVSATVYNQSAKIIKAKNKIEQPYVFELQKNSNQREIWSIEVTTDSPEGIVSLRQGKQLEGFFASSAPAVLKRK